MGFAAGMPDGIADDQTRRAIAAFAQLQHVSAEITPELLRRTTHAKDDGFRNFLGCRTERSPPTVHATERVPVEVTAWERDSIDVSVREGHACDPSLVCGFHPLLGPGYPDYGARCDQQCEIVQKRLFSAKEHDVLANLEQQCRHNVRRDADDDFRNVRVARVPDIDCQCPGGSMCHCSYRSHCTFERLEKYEEFQTKAVEKTVYDDREVCECRAPEVSGRANCVAPTVRTVS